MSMLYQWPDVAECLLLHAALDEGDSALTAFARWSAGIDWAGDIEGGSFRLLPLVHANLSRQGAQHRMMGRLAGVHRYHWCAAQTHMRRGGALVQRLREAGIPVMLSKGLALATSVYDSPALRPMSDIDILVSPAQAVATLDLLLAAGWAEEPATARQWRHRRGDMLLLTIGDNLHHPREGEVDLHWALMHEAGGTGLDEAVWASACQTVIAGVPVPCPAPAFMLLHVIAHGLRPNALSPLRWVADAAMLLRRQGHAIDWPLFHHWAAVLAVRHRVAQGLAFLRDEMQLPVPAAALPDTLPTPDWLEWLEDRCWQKRIAVEADLPPTMMERGVQLARLACGRHRRALPRLALGWVSRRLPGRRMEQGA
jgi:hypothetical protein